MDAEEGRLPSDVGDSIMNQFDLPDGPRLVRFKGERLATVDADDGERIRWIELSLYKTQAGKYIVHQVGKTVVYHRLNSDCKPKAFSTQRLWDLPEDSAPCPVCTPPDISLDRDADNVETRLEADLSRVLVHPDVPTLILALENTKPQGRRYHSRVARDLLVEAAKKDQVIREAFLVMEVA